MELDLEGYRDWLINNQNYSKKTISNTVSRMKRANRILSWFNDPVYLFELERESEFKELSCSVRSQIRRAVKLYFEFLDNGKSTRDDKARDIKVLSLFANIGVAEAYFDEIGIEVPVANELEKRRADLYSKIYPETNMICGDITNEEILEKIINLSIENGVNTIVATPPCQGMSTVGRLDKNDKRNKLIVPVIEIIKRVKPKYVFIENVPNFLNTIINIEGEDVLIPHLIERELKSDYLINDYVIDTKNYSVPSTRERAIILMTQKNMGIKEWKMPEKDTQMVTMQDAIGHLPILDPYITDISEDELLEIFPRFYERKSEAEKISKWHIPPHHVKRQVIAMQHTPTGCTAFDNEKHYPKKENGERVRGYRNTYKRQNWSTPAYTVTMDNRKISSQENVHPGRLEYVNSEGEEIYSDPRALTLYEIMIIMSIPESWPLPDDISEAFVRRIIGEGIPPLFVKRVFENLN